MKAMLQRMRSRKFLAAAAGIVVGVAMALGLDENTITTAAGAITALVSVIAYIIDRKTVTAEKPEVQRVVIVRPGETSAETAENDGNEAAVTYETRAKAGEWRTGA